MSYAPQKAASGGCGILRDRQVGDDILPYCIGQKAWTMVPITQQYTKVMNVFLLQADVVLLCCSVKMHIPVRWCWVESSHFTCVITFLANSPMYFCPIGSSSMARISVFLGSPSVRCLSLLKVPFSVSVLGRIYSSSSSSGQSVESSTTK